MTRRSLEYSAQQRAGMLVYWFTLGERLTVAQIAAKLELTERGAYSMLRNIAAVVPIVKEGEHWQAAQTAQTAQDARETLQGGNIPQSPAARVLARPRGSD